MVLRRRRGRRRRDRLGPARSACTAPSPCCCSPRSPPLTALSVTWAIVPELAYIEAGRTLAYLAVFAAGVAGARLAPRGADVAIKGIVLAAIAATVYALAARVWPGTIGENEISNRIGQPFEYWNAVGTTAALAIPGLLWLGSRRGGKRRRARGRLSGHGRRDPRDPAHAVPRCPGGRGDRGRRLVRDRAAAAAQPARPPAAEHRRRARRRVGAVQGRLRRDRPAPRRQGERGGRVRPAAPPDGRRARAGRPGGERRPQPLRPDRRGSGGGSGSPRSWWRAPCRSWPSPRWR